MQHADENRAHRKPSWAQLIEQLHSLRQAEQYYRLLPYIELCCQTLKDNKVDFTDSELIDQIHYIISLLVELDEIAHEKNYRKALGRAFIAPLLATLQSHSASAHFADLRELIKIKLPYLHDVAIKHARLCGHNANCLDDFLGSKEDSPLKTLLELHKYFIAYAQESLEQLSDIVIVMRVLDYWQVLQLDNLAAFEAQSIVPLLNLGEYLLQLVQHSRESVKKEKALRLVLYLQMLVRDHPAIKKLNYEEWSESGFVSCFSPSFASNAPQSLGIRPVTVCALLKDFRPQLQNSRAKFRDKDHEILAVQRDHSQAVKSMLKEMFEAAIGVFGRPPCELVLCILGSTGRSDRKPYSDIEYMVLHSAVEEGVKRAIDIYIGHVLSVFELMIVRLGETPDNKSESVGRLRVDTSALENKLWGTPQEMAERCVTGWVQERSEFLGHHYRRLLHVALPLLPEENDRDIDTLYLIEENDVIVAHYTEEGVWCSSKKTKLALSKIIKLNKKESDDKNEIAKVLAFFKTMPSNQWLSSQLYEYLEPAPISQSALRANDLLKEYYNRIEAYLQKMISEEDRPERVIHTIQWNMPNWWKGLNQGQAIALICLHDIVNESAKLLNKEFQPDQIINLKKIYYKPLVYFALNLKLYFGWNEPASPIEILQKYCGELKWGGEALYAWLKAALSFVTEVQVKMHLDAGYQKDTVNYKLDSEEEGVVWAGLDLIAQSLIKPLETLMKDFFEWSLSIETIAYDLLKKNLNVRRSWLEKWTKKGVDRDSLLQHPLIRSLSSYPDESGWSPQMELLLKYHYEGLLTLSDNEKTDCQLAGVPPISMQQKTPQYLKARLTEQCFVEGQFVGDPELSSERSQVKRVMMGSKSWYIKVKEGNLEGLIAREYLAMMLHLLLGGKPQIALGWSIKFTLHVRGKEVPFYAWISEGVEGVSLAAKMTAFADSWQSMEFERENFSQLFLFTFLTCPEDGQPENFKVIEDEHKLKLIALDYGQCFVVADRKEKKFFGKDVSVLTIKTMIYLLGAMNEPLAEDLITRIRLLDVNAWYSSWQASLEGINALFKSLLEKDRGQIVRLIGIPEGVLLCIKSRLALLQHWLRTTQKPITGQSILDSLEPMVASQYASLRPKIKLPEDFYKRIDVKAYIKDPKSGKMISSATWESLQQQTLSPGQLARSCGLESKYFRRVDFSQLDESQQEYHLQLLEAVAENKGASFTKLILRGCFIEENRLIRLLEKMPHLEVLDLSDCQGLDAMTVAKLLVHRPDATIFSYNIKILCPKLSFITVSIGAENRTLELSASLEKRQLLSKKLRNFVGFFELVIQNLLKKLANSDPSVPEIIEALGTLGRAEGRVVEALWEARWNYMDEQIHSLVAIALVKLGSRDDPVLELLVNALDSDKFVSGDVAFELEQLGKTDDRVIELLLEVLRSVEILQSSVAEILGVIGRADDNIMEALLDALKNPNGEGRYSVAEALGKLSKGEDHVIEALLSVVNDFDVKVRQSVIIALRSVKDDRVIEVLLRALEDSDEKVAQLAAISLGQGGITDDRMIEMLLRASDAIGEMGSLAENALKQLERDGKGVIRVLLKALDDSDEKTRQSAVRILGELGVPEEQVINALLLALDDSNVKVSECAAKSLGQCGKRDERVVNALLKTLNNKKWKVRYAAIETLKEVGAEYNRWLIPELIKKLGDIERLVRNTAAEILCRISKEGDYVVEVFFTGLEDSKAEVRSACATGLGFLEKDDDLVIDALLKAMKDLNDEVRYSAVEALGQIKNAEDRVIDALVKALEDSYVLVRGSAAKALGQINKAENRVIDALARGLRDFSMSVRHDMARALDQLGKGEDRFIKALLKRMRDYEGQEFEMAERDLFHWGLFGKAEDRVIEPLVKALDDSEDSVRSAVIKALGVLLTPEHCWTRIQKEVQLVTNEKSISLENAQYDNITKRIFFFVDYRSRQVLPQVCRKWRDLYAEFKEDQLLLEVPELRLVSETVDQQSSSISFFKNFSDTPASVNDEEAMERGDINSAPVSEGESEGDDKGKSEEDWVVIQPREGKFTK